MDDNSRDRLTLARRFLEPSNSTHRQYEALRAFFVDRLPSAEVAARFGYSPGSFRVLVHQFRSQPDRDSSPRPHARAGHPANGNGCGNRSSPCASRTSPSMTSAALGPRRRALSPAAVAAILKEEGFAKLPRRATRSDPNSPGPSSPRSPTFAGWT